MRYVTDHVSLLLTASVTCTIMSMSRPSVPDMAGAFQTELRPKTTPAWYFAFGHPVRVALSQPAS